jgi:hypothetical protein
MARDVLHDGDGAFADQRDGHCMGAHAVARDAADGAEGARSGTRRNRSMIVTDLVDLGLALVFAIVALAITALLKFRTKAAARRSGRRGRR